MRVGCMGLLLCVVVGLSMPMEGIAEEFAGKLQRVGIYTVTVVGSDNRKVVMRVKRGQRRKAAPYIGKSVRVGFRTERGVCNAISFRSLYNGQ